MANERLYQMKFKDLYPLYLTKVVKKGRNEQELVQVITWLTGYREDTLLDIINSSTTIKEFFVNAPKMHPYASLITGTICGVQIESIEDPLMKQIRYLDKLVDELAKQKPMAKILRVPASK